MKKNLLWKHLIASVFILFFIGSINVNAQVHIGVTNYTTIQDAINGASPGDLITVDPGTYSEAVTINKSIHLQGQSGQVLNTIIQAPSNLPLPATQNSNIVTVTGAGINVEINDLTITGPGPSGCGSINYGIFVRNSAYANIHDNRIIEVRDNPFSGCQNGVAIQIGRMAWSTTGTATITNNIITGYQKNGITVDNTGSDAIISGNTITGAGTTSIIAQNGIQISRGATGTLTGNTVTGNSYHNTGNPSDWGSTGILLYQSGIVTLSGGNNLSGNDQNYYAYDPSGVLTMGAEVFGTSSAPVGFGNQIVNYTSQNIDARSCTFNAVSPAAMTMTQLFTLEDFIFHRIDNPTIGLVYVSTNNVYVTTNSFDATESYNDAQIQRGIDAASNGFTVNVQSGSYAKQIATNRNVFGVNGPHQFGLFIDKDNLTIRGYDVTDNPVADASAAAVVFTTGATNNFGSSGIFVQANGVTLEGLKVGNNYNNSNVKDNNKTIEIVGDAFSMSKCWINTDVDEGAVYMGRWDASHPIVSYAINQNKFENTLVSINNGAGLSGPRTGRVITNNEFVGVATPYLIGFRGWNGAGPVQGWIVDPVGGAVITGNLFNTTGVDKYVVARGNAGGYINSELIWADIWNLNTYGNHVVTLENYPAFDVRTYADAAGYTETRRISPMIQENINIGQTGDVILVSAGTYNENVTVNKSLTINGANAGVSCTVGPRGPESSINGLPGTTAAVRVISDGVTVDGFTITNPGGIFGIGVYNSGKSNLSFTNNIVTNVGNNTLANTVYGIYFEVGTAGNTNMVNISNNCVSNIFGGNSGNPKTAGGIYVGNSGATAQVSNLTILSNTVDNVNSGRGAYGILINTGAGNTTGSVVSGRIESNVISGLNGSWAHGIGLEGRTPGAQILNNKISGLTSSGLDNFAVTLQDNSGAGSTFINNNSFVTSGFSVGNAMTDAVNATCNWHGTYDATAIALKIAGNVVYDLWLTSGVDNDPAMTGFQPIANSCQGTANMLSANKCGKKNENKVKICHNGKTICISTSDVQSHFDHGDQLGKCVGSLENSEIEGRANVQDPFVLLPGEYKLSNYPNPFFSATRIFLELPEDSKLSLKVYDMTGREVSVLFDGNKKAGSHVVEFNASRLGSGVYIAIMQASVNGKVNTKSVKIMKQ